MIFHSNIVILVWIIFRCFAKETWDASAFQIPFLSADPNPGKRLVFFNKKEASHTVKHGSSKQFLANNAEAFQQIFRDRGSPSKNMTLETLLCQHHLNHFCGPVSVSFLLFFLCEYKLFLTLSSFASHYSTGIPSHFTKSSWSLEPLFTTGFLIC